MRLPSACRKPKIGGFRLTSDPVGTTIRPRITNNSDWEAIHAWTVEPVRDDCRGLPAVPLAAQAQAPAPALPDGPAKQLVDGVCAGCHQTNMITQSLGYTREGWHELIGTMIDLRRAPDQQAAITNYLAEHFRRNTTGAPPSSCPARTRSPSTNG